MKKILLALALLLLPSVAFAQCNGVFPPNTACGNNSGSPALPFPISTGSLSSIAIGGTPITGGVSGRILYDNAGLFGEIAPTGTGNVVLGTSPTISSPTLTGTPTGAGATITINGTSCSLAGSCSLTAAGVTVGTTTIGSGTTNGLLYDNAGVLGNLATINSGVLVTSNVGAPSISTTLPNGLSAASLTLTSSTLNGLTVTSTTGTLTIAAGKTLTDTSSVGADLLLGATGGGFAAYGGATCTNQALTALSPTGAGTCASVTSAFISGPLTLAVGGTNAALVASNGGIVYSDASKLQILAGTITAGQCLLSGSSAAPTWGSCSGAAAVSSVTNSDSTLTVSPTTGAVVASLNLTHANTWTAVQTFTNSDIRLLGSSTGYTTFSSSNSGASNFTLTFPSVTDTIAVLGTNQTFNATETIAGSLVCTGNIQCGTWTQTGSNIYNSNAGNVGVGTSVPEFDANSAKFLAVINNTAHGFAEVGTGGNASSVGDNAGTISFVNSSLGTTDKRIAQILGVTDTATNNGDMIFLDWDAGTPRQLMTINYNGTINMGTSAGSGVTSQLCLNGGCVTTLASTAPVCTPANSIGFSPSNSASANSSAWSTWAASISTTYNCLEFAGGKYEFSGNAAVSLPNAITGLTIKGVGNQATILDWSGGGGISATFNNCGNSIHVRDLSITTGAVNVGSGLLVNNVASCPNLNQTFVSSDVSNVLFYGNDRTNSAAGANYWGNALHVFGVTYFNVNYSDFEGAQSHAGVGILYESSSTTIGGAMYITGSNFYALGDGIVYGNFAQGIQITSGSCVGVLVCIFAPSSESGLDVLEVDQFDMSTAYLDCLLISSPIASIQITGGTCINFGGDGTNGITLAQSDGFSIVGMAFINGAACTGTNAGNSCVALYVNNAAAGSNAGIITGNQFINWTFPVQLDTASARVNVQSNGYSGNAHNNCQLPFNPSFPTCSAVAGGNQFGGGSQ